MTTPLVLFVSVAAFFASVLGSLSGFGVSVVMMPVLVLVLGARDAVPALTIATLVGNLSRVAFNRAELRFSAAGWYLLGAVPAAAAGGFCFAHAPERLLAVLMAAFLIGSVIYRNVRKREERAAGPPMTENRLAVVGLCTGALSALVGGAGPLVAPFFLAAGLTKAAFIGTEALAAAGVHIVKLGAYGSAQVMSAQAALAGLIAAPSIILGSWAGKQIIDRVSQQTFARIIESMMLAAALTLVVRAAGLMQA
jgi:uncharacterized membrane protein YfcA